MSRFAVPTTLASEYFPFGVGTDYELLTQNLREAYEHYRQPVSRRHANAAQRFQAYVERWKSERGPTSSIVEMSMHHAYQQIIGMGPTAIPLILRELQNNPDHWFWALQAITGTNPVPPAQRGSIKQMAELWIHWGKENGYEW